MTSTFEIGFVMLLLATVTVALETRIRVPVEVLLVLGSLLLSFVPGLPRITFSPELVFLVFLPPVLFSAAYFTSWNDFKANKRPISLLAIGCVLISSAAVAAVFHLLMPQASWATGFALGAMVSAPDASAATSIIRKLGAPRRLVTIIEGESLVNDATALIIYRFSIASIMSGHFSLPSAIARFFVVALGGISIGLLVAYVAFQGLLRLEDTKGRTMASLLAAFGSYLIAEQLHFSGVIATVVGGLFFGRFLPLSGSAQTRLDGRAHWELLVFLINCAVFMLIGLQLPTIVQHLGQGLSMRLTAYAALITLTVIVVRFIWVFPATYLPRFLFRSIRKNDPYPSWKAPTIISWTGMRGIVSLATALALPTTLPSGAAFPERDVLLFIVYVVILVTLTVPALTLPWLMRRLGVHAGDESEREALQARRAAALAVLNAMEGEGTRSVYSEEQVTSLQRRYRARLSKLEGNLANAAFTPLIDEDRQLRRLLHDTLAWERSALTDLRRQGRIHDEVFHVLESELDVEEIRLQSGRF